MQIFMLLLIFSYFKLKKKNIGAANYETRNLSLFVTLGRFVSGDPRKCSVKSGESSILILFVLFKSQHSSV